jgi:hypothetical protein
MTEHEVVALVAEVRFLPVSATCISSLGAT